MRTECTFTFFGQEYTCIRESRPSEPDFGGDFDVPEKKLCVDKKYDEDTFLNYVHHELLEIAIYLSGCTYTKEYPEEKDMFFMDHSLMDVVSGAVCGAFLTIKRKMITNHKI